MYIYIHTYIYIYIYILKQKIVIEKKASVRRKEEKKSEKFEGTTTVKQA